MSNIYLQHHGIKGQKWGVRRFQNEDGSYTSAGKKRYGSDGVNDAKAAYKSAKKDYNKSFNKAYNRAGQAYSLSKTKRQENEKRWEDVADKSKVLNKAKMDYKSAKAKYKMERDIDKFTKDDQKLFDTRAKNRDKMETKFDKKIEKAERKSAFAAELLKEQKAATLRDFDEGTKFIKKGMEVVNKKYSEFLQMKVDSITNPSIKKTADYKKAGREYLNIKDSKPMAVFNESAIEARKQYAKKQ